MFDQIEIHPESIKVTDRDYSRAMRRNGTFVVISENEFVMLKSTNPLILDTTQEIKKASLFTWKNAERVCDKLIHTNPKIKMIVRKNQKLILV